MSSRQEPYTGFELCRVIESNGGRLIHQEGSHCKYLMPDGREVIGKRLNKVVDANMAHNVAKQLGMTFAAYRQWVGFPLSAAGKFTHKPTQRRKLATKSDLMAELDILDDLIDEARGLSMSIRNEFRNGQRDAAAYQSAIERVSKLKAKLPRKAVAA